MSLEAVARETARRLEAARELNATLAWSEAALLAEAERAAKRPAQAPLRGMPIAIKDNIVTIEQPTTCASRILEGYRSPFDATAVVRLREAGALVACKTNLDEFAMGSSTEHSAFGRVRHPLDPSRVPGGSSGGSAALVAAGVVPAALGSETGGSVRQPAAFCGCVGLKPSYGRVSRYGLVAFGSSLDCVSVFGRTVDDAARVLAAISGHDPLDSTTMPAPPLTLPAPRSDLTGLTIGVPREYLPAGPGSRRQGLRGPDPGAGRGAGRCGQRGVAPPLAVRGAHLLHHRPRRGGGEPGPVRRRPLRGPGGARGRGRPRALPRDPRAGVRRRGAAPDHDRNLRAERRVLRRLLRHRPGRPGPAGGRLRGGVRRRGRPAPHPDHPDRRIQGRRKARRSGARCIWPTSSSPPRTWWGSRP